jgi:Cu(I)/Ag(I) efflux system membrane protein CusA/SilA
MEGKLFSPLAWTKSFILIVDVFSYYTDPSSNQLLAERKLRPENKNPINKMESWYTPILIFCLKWRKAFYW